MTQPGNVYTVTSQGHQSPPHPPAILQPYQGEDRGHCCVCPPPTLCPPRVFWEHGGGSGGTHTFIARQRAAGSGRGEGVQRQRFGGGWGGAATPPPTPSIPFFLEGGRVFSLSFPILNPKPPLPQVGSILVVPEGTSYQGGGGAPPNIPTCPPPMSITAGSCCVWGQSSSPSGARRCSF